jgi:hypothetical protein
MRQLRGEEVNLAMHTKEVLAGVIEVDHAAEAGAEVLVVPEADPQNVVGPRCSVGDVENHVMDEAVLAPGVAPAHAWEAAVAAVVAACHTVVAAAVAAPGFPMSSHMLGHMDSRTVKH